MGTLQRLVVLTLLGYGIFLSADASPAEEKPSMIEPLAEVDGVLISNEEVEKALGAPLAKLQEDIYELKRQKIESLINEKLLAKEVAK